MVNTETKIKKKNIQHTLIKDKFFQSIYLKMYVKPIDY